MTWKTERLISPHLFLPEGTERVGGAVGNLGTRRTFLKEAGNWDKIMSERFQNVLLQVPLKEN